MNRLGLVGRISFVIWALVSMPLYAFADDVTDSINEALQHYKDGAYSEAVESLTYSSRLIQQKKSGELASLLPGPLKGWVAEDAASDSSVTAFGGGISVSRKYNKDASSVSIDLMADSPMLQGMLMLFSNPMFAQADGGKMVKIGKQKAVLKYDAKESSGELTIVVDNRILVKVSGTGVKSDDLSAYANAIDYAKIEALP